MKLSQKDIQRFWANVNKTNNCWLWTSATHKGRNGFARAVLSVGGRKGKMEYAARISWQIHYGLFGRLKVLHKCDNPICVNPIHLFLGTQGENVKDMWAKGRGHKQRGEQMPTAKLTEEQVKYIRSVAVKGQYTRLGRQYGVTAVTIRNLVNYNTWRHI